LGFFAFQASALADTISLVGLVLLPCFFFSRLRWRPECF